MLSRVNGQWDVQSILKLCPMAEEDALLIFARLLEREASIELKERLRRTPAGSTARRPMTGAICRRSPISVLEHRRA